MTIEQGIQIFSGFCYGISATLLIQMVNRWLSKKEKQRRSQSIDMIELQSRIEDLESDTKILSTQAGNIILSQHKTADQTRQNFKDILRRVKELEERQTRVHEALKDNTRYDLMPRLENLESYIKQFSDEDLKRMRADEYVLDDLTNRLAILESTLKAHIEISNKH